MIKNPVVAMFLAGIASLFVGGLAYSILGANLLSLLIESSIVLVVFFVAYLVLSKTTDELADEATKLQWSNLIGEIEGHVKNCEEQSEHFTDNENVYDSIVSMVAASRIISKNALSIHDIVRLTDLNILLEDLDPGLKKMATLKAEGLKTLKLKKEMAQLEQDLVELETGFTNLVSKGQGDKASEAAVKFAAMKRKLKLEGLLGNSRKILDEIESENNTEARS